MINLVSLDGQKYMVDVGFGVDGAIEPLPLKDGYTTRVQGRQSVRLRWTSIAPNTDPSQRLWVFQTRKDDDSPWNFQYCFTELEFLPEDFAVMNYATRNHPTSFFTSAVMAVKTVLEDEKVIGELILFGNEIKRRSKGETETLMKFETESQRIEALKKWFDISLTGDEQRGIKGMVTEIK